MSETETVHIDLAAFVGGMQMFLGHQDIQFDMGENPSVRFRQLSTLLMETAWELESKADLYESFVPRCFRTKLGDTWFEVIPDGFVDGEDYAEAQAIFASGNEPIDLEQLRNHYPDIEEV